MHKDVLQSEYQSGSGFKLHIYVVNIAKLAVDIVAVDNVAKAYTDKFIKPNQPRG